MYMINWLKNYEFRDVVGLELKYSEEYASYSAL
jgi:hypothetical protein